MTKQIEPSRNLWRWVNLPLIGMIWGYRLTLAPMMSGHCRFVPTCSSYALDAYRAHNPILATWLVVRRLVRCHPWGGGGYDPVPSGRSSKSARPEEFV